MGWFSVFTTDKNMERPIMIVSMVEDVKGRGGSGYVVKKDSQVLEKWFSVISIGFSMGISGCKGNTEEPVSSELLKLSVRKEWMTIL